MKELYGRVPEWRPDFYGGVTADKNKRREASQPHLFPHTLQREKKKNSGTKQKPKTIDTNHTKMCTFEHIDSTVGWLKNDTCFLLPLFLLVCVGCSQYFCFVKWHALLEEGSSCTKTLCLCCCHTCKNPTCLKHIFHRRSLFDQVKCDCCESLELYNMQHCYPHWHHLSYCGPLSVTDPNLQNCAISYIFAMRPLEVMKWW